MPEKTTTVPPTLDQRRARHAWDSFRSLARSPGGPAREYDDVAKEYAREAKKLPTRILAAGLGQALAFLAAKAADRKKSLNRLLDHLTDWVLIKRPIRGTHPQSLLESVVYGHSDFLRRATDETLAYLSWLNRFAEAELGPEGIGEEK
jgi:CRISPR-associated protein Cmr5